MNILPDAVDTLPRAGGRIISDAAADQAAEWLTLLMSGAVTEDDQSRLQQWRTAHPDNELAWQHIEAVIARLKGLHGTAAYRSLSTLGQAKSPGRRKHLAMLLGIGMAGAAGLLNLRTPSSMQLATDMRTGVGEQREWILDDGTHLMLNTASIVERYFDDQQRLLRLSAGEIRVTTGKEVAERPLIVQTAEGRIRALGTVFTVRQHATHTEVAVQKSAVEIVPVRAQHAARIIRAGQSTWFSQEQVAMPSAAVEDKVAWVQGMLVADDVRLADFLLELDRYRHGSLFVDPAIADLRFSGVFPIGDANRILTLLPNSLPVHIRSQGFGNVMVEADQHRLYQK